MITKPQLPPRKGYVEVETATGECIYQMTDEYKNSQSARLFQIY